MFGCLVKKGGIRLNSWFEDYEKGKKFGVTPEELEDLENDEFSLAEAAFIEGYEDDEEDFE